MSLSWVSSTATSIEYLTLSDSGPVSREKKYFSRGKSNTPVVVMCIGTSSRSGCESSADYGYWDHGFVGVADRARVRCGHRLQGCGPFWGPPEPAAPRTATAPGRPEPCIPAGLGGRGTRVSGMPALRPELRVPCARIPCTAPTFRIPAFLAACYCSIIC